MPLHGSGAGSAVAGERGGEVRCACRRLSEAGAASGGGAGRCGAVRLSASVRGRSCLPSARCTMLCICGPVSGASLRRRQLKRSIYPQHAAPAAPRPPEKQGRSPTVDSSPRGRSDGDHTDSPVTYDRWTLLAVRGERNARAACTWLEKPGWTGRDLPLRTPLIPSPGWDRGDPIYNENGPLLLLLDCFSATAIVVGIGGFGPIATFGNPFPRGPPRPGPLHLSKHFSRPARATGV